MFLPDRYYCNKLTKDFPEVFFKKETVIEGYNVEIYNYMFASYKDFKENSAQELRGITFVLDGEQWVRHLALNKFHNVNENEDWNFEILKDKKITNVQDKRDGSLITFVKFPNGVIRAKSKMSFDSDQAKMAQEIFDKDANLRSYVKTAMSLGDSPIFELTSPHNQIVLNYSNTELTLLQVRRSSGVYFSRRSLMTISLAYNISLTEQLELHSLEYLMKYREIAKNIEGWVVTFEDGMLAKIKTEDYLSKHSIFTELREDVIINLTLDEKIDDVLSELNGEKKKFVEKVVELTLKNTASLLADYKILRKSFFNDFNSDRKSFALENVGNPLFGLVMRNISKNNSNEEVVKNYIKQKCNSLSSAKEFLKGK